MDFFAGVTMKDILEGGFSAAMLLFIFKYGPSVIQTGKELAVSLSKLSYVVENQEVAMKEKLTEVMMGCSRTNLDRSKEVAELKELLVTTLRTVERIDNQFPTVQEIKQIVNHTLLIVQKLGG